MPLEYADFCDIDEDTPRDGTHILAILRRDGSYDMDNIWRPTFEEIREIWYKPYTMFHMFLPWHAGDPFDSHDSVASCEHYGEDVPVKWCPMPACAPKEG